MTEITTAARLLREAAAELKNAHTLGGDWGNEHEALDAYNEHMATATTLEHMGRQCLAQIEEPAQPVAEICSASHDDAQFGERAIKPLCDISSFDYGTQLYAGAAPAAASGPSAGVDVMCERLKAIAASDSKTAMRNALMNAARYIAGSAQAAPQAPAAPADAQAFAEWWDRERGTARNRLPGDDWMDLRNEDREQYEAAFNAGMRAAPAAPAGDARVAIEKLPRYTYGYKSDEWGMNSHLTSYKAEDGKFLLRDDVLSALAAQAKEGGAQ